MKLSVWFEKEQQAPFLESFVYNKATDAFSKYNDRLSSGELRLRYEESADGPITYCSLDLKSHLNGVIHVTESDSNGQAAVLKAIRVAQSKLKRMSERRKHSGRSRGRSAKIAARDFVLDPEMN